MGDSRERREGREERGDFGWLGSASQVALMKAGHLANARGETRRALQLFRECFDKGGRVEARISAANMSCKLGDYGGALKEYEAMQSFIRSHPNVLSPRVAKVIQRKHLEASLAVQQVAVENNFLLSGAKISSADEVCLGSSLIATLDTPSPSHSALIKLSPHPRTPLTQLTALPSQRLPPSPRADYYCRSSSHPAH